MVKRIFNSYKGYAWNSLLLLLPGAIGSLLIFLLSAGKLMPQNEATTLVILNLIQLLMLGITVAKYGIDQIILSRLDENSYIDVRSLYLYRVIPLTILFSVVIGFLNGYLFFFYFLLSLPLEVFVIIVSVELNISRKPHYSLLIVLMGYPLILGVLFFLNKILHLDIIQVLCVFFAAAVLKFFLALFFRNKNNIQDIAILSYHIPFQQVSNFVMFRLDQLLIAAGIYSIIFNGQFSANNYLFLAKFPEVSSGIIVGLAPILYRKFGNSENFSISGLLKEKMFILLSLALLFFQLLINIYILGIEQFLSKPFIYLPFFLITILILPANLVTYVLIRSTSLSLLNKLNAISIVLGCVVFGAAVLFSSIKLFCMIIPVQLIAYIILYNKLSNDKSI